LSGKIIVSVFIGRMSILARKIIRGVAKKYSVPGSGPRGYRPVWDMGPAAYSNRIKKVTGVNRPST
jgi:hypothetical protein